MLENALKYALEQRHHCAFISFLHELLYLRAGQCFHQGLGCIAGLLSLSHCHHVAVGGSRQGLGILSSQGIADFKPASIA